MTKKTKENTVRVSSVITLIVPAIIIPIVIYTMFSEHPELWVALKNFLFNTWPGMFVLVLACIPVLCMSVYLPVRLYVYMTHPEKKGFWI